MNHNLGEPNSDAEQKKLDQKEDSMCDSISRKFYKMQTILQRQQAGPWLFRGGDREEDSQRDLRTWR